MVFTGLVLLAIAAVGGGASFWFYTTQRAALQQQAEAALEVTSDNFVESLTRLFEPATRAVENVRQAGLHVMPFDRQVDVFNGIAAGTVQQLDQVNGIYLGYPDGRFVHTQDIVPGVVMDQLEPQERGTLLVRRLIDEPWWDKHGRWEIRLEGRQNWVPTAVQPREYDPRVRPWYQRAVEAGEPVWTAPYTFASTGELGTTYAVPLYDPTGRLWAVAGIDLSLQSLSRILLTTLESVSRTDDVIFATDLARRIIGHPDFAASEAIRNPDVAEVMRFYRRPESLESQLTQSLREADRVALRSFTDRDYLAIRRDLQDGDTLPMSIFLARDLDVILNDATQTLIRNVILLFFALFLFGAVFAYAAKLQVEVALRKRLQGELVEAKEVAEAATKAKSTFLATMSHEIRTPMNGVMSMAELLTLTKMNGEQRNMTRIILDSAQSLLTIINDILDFSKIEAGKLDIETIPFSLRETVYGTGELLVAKSDEKQIGLTVLVDPTLPDRLLGDPTRIRQILLNLAGNAIKFTESGEVVVRVARGAPPEHGDGPAAHSIHFSVRDTGIGLTQEQVGKLFKPFQQADQSTSRKFGGTGLGLSICHRLTDLMGGRIGVDSVAGHGSTFWFDLPLEASGDADPAPDPALAAIDVVMLGLTETAADAANAILAHHGAAVFRAVEARAEEEGDRRTLYLADPGAVDLAALPLAEEDTLAVVQRRADSFAAAKLARRPHLKLTYPLSEHDLVRALRVAAGLEKPDTDSAEQRADMQFAAPDRDAAAMARAVVLVAEDNPTNQTVIRQMLDRLGYACDIADNGREALEMLDRAAHGFLLSDFNMPEMDGFELTRAVRAQAADRERRLPIVALTADAIGGTQEACLEAGMDGFLTKPIDSVALGKTLAEHMPQALDLRVSAEARAGDEGDDLGGNGRGGHGRDGHGRGGNGALDEPDVFDPDRLIESFGALDADALAFAGNFAADAENMIDRFLTAAESGDEKHARHEVHAIKGAARSVGAVHLGNLASDLQDMVDEGNVALAAMLGEGLKEARSDFAAHIERRRQAE